MKKKYNGAYTAAARKIIKQSFSLHCQTTEDGGIYVANGYWCFAMTAEDYDQIVRPVSACDPGNWIIDSTGKHDGKHDLSKIFADAAKASLECVSLESAPMLFASGKSASIAALYDPDKDFAAFYNAGYLAAVSGLAVFRAPSPTSPVVAFIGPDPVALVMPIKPNPENARAVRAYFRENPKMTELKEQLKDKERELSDALDLAESLTAQIQELKAEAAATEPAQQTPAATAESIASHWSQVSGITATVKGAKTAAPIVWLSGDLDAHAQSIEASGGRWSGKRSAYYFRVA